MSTCTPACSGQHCGQISEQINNNCKQQGWPQNHCVLICNPITGECCNCTCSCLAYGTPVGIPDDQTKQIQEFKIGDLVTAYNPDGTSAYYKVEFSDGTSPSSVQPEMAYVTYADEAGAETTIIVTLDHTFLRPDGRLIRASMLVPGMTLARTQGGEATIRDYRIKGYTGGVWNIATSLGRPDSMDGHLIDTQGLLSGDYALQLFYGDFVATGQALTAEETPEVTSQRHNEAMAVAGVSTQRESITVTEFMAGARGAVEVLASGGRHGGGGVFLHHDDAIELTVPVAAAIHGFLTDAQAAEVSAKLLRPTERTANAMTQTQWLSTLFHGFYEEVNIIIDAPNHGANAYSFFLGEQKYLLIQGGLIRAEPLSWQGLALVLAYCVNRFYGGAPYGIDGMTCKPQADYGIVGVLNNVYYPLYPNVVFDAVNQVKALFEQIGDKADNPVQGCHETTLDCRVQTYYAAMQYLDLPSCAGGPTVDLLEVVAAHGENDGSVIVEFNEAVNITSAQQPENYSFDPDAPVTSAGVMTGDTRVRLEGDFASRTDYTVTVSGVTTLVGYPLDPDKDSASFDMP